MLHVMDLWPDSVVATGFARPGRSFDLFMRGLDAWCDQTYRWASSVAYIAPGVGELLRERGVPEDKLHYVPVWADETVFFPSQDDSLRLELGLGDAVVLLYAGALGPVQGIDTLVEACARVQDLEGFHCIVAGSGTNELALRRRTAELGLRNLTFLGHKPKPEMTRVMAAGDVHLISLRSDPLSSITLPSKVQATLASGRASIVAIDGDAARVARESGAGIPVTPGSVEELEAAIRSSHGMGRAELAALGRLGRVYYDREFAVDIGVCRVSGVTRSGRSGLIEFPKLVTQARRALGGRQHRGKHDLDHRRDRLLRPDDDPSLAHGDCAEVRVLSRDETKQDEMRRTLGDDGSATSRRHPGAIRASRIRDVDYVFHAAALKQVPSCEFFPVEAVRTNILGSENVIERGGAPRGRLGGRAQHGQGRLPDQRDGHVQSMMEKVAQAHGAESIRAVDTTVSCVRYGNVMYSRGSVIPLFVAADQGRQRADGHRPDYDAFPDVPDESVDLVELAFAATPGPVTSSFGRPGAHRQATSRSGVRAVRRPVTSSPSVSVTARSS